MHKSLKIRVRKTRQRYTWTRLPLDDSIHANGSWLRGFVDQLHEVGHPGLLKPADLVKGCPQLGGFVDVDFTGLLCIRLAELLSHLKTLSTTDKHPPLARQVGSTIESKIGGECNLIRVQEVTMRVIAQIDWCSFPIHLEAVGSFRERIQRRAEVGKRGKILIFPVWRNCATW